jgi:hypothetical protein
LYPTPHTVTSRSAAPIARSLRRIALT